LLVVVTKADVWDRAVEGSGRKEPWTQAHGQWVFEADKVDRLSGKVRDLLAKLCPELIQAAEGFFTNVTYVPVTALGHAPQANVGGRPAIRPTEIRPLWVTVPFLTGLRQVTDLVPA
jgi:hypothetical protein